MCRIPPPPPLIAPLCHSVMILLEHPVHLEHLCGPTIGSLALPSDCHSALLQLNLSKGMLVGGVSTEQDKCLCGSFFMLAYELRSNEFDQGLHSPNIRLGSKAVATPGGCFRGCLPQTQNLQGMLQNENTESLVQKIISRR